MPESEINILQPQLQKVKTQRKGRKLTIGVLKENMQDEKRVALTPVGVSSITKEGHIVLIESGSGLGANYTDTDFVEAGAQIVPRNQIVSKSDILVKISPMNTAELRLLPPNKILFSALHPSTQSRENIEILLQKHITAVAYEFYSDRDGNNPFLFLMDEIMGSSSVMIASELLTNTAGGKGIMLGGLTGVSATEVIVIGTDLAAEYAVKVAKSLGATVKVFDRDLSGLWRMENKFGTDLFTSTLNYKMLEKSLASADVLINTKTRHSDEEYIITAEMVKRMKHGAIIVDIRTDVGSVIETSRPTTFEHPMYEKYGVIHYCVPNIPSRVAKTASIAISNVLTQILLEICRAGNFYTVLRRSDSLRNGVYTFLGKLTNSFLAEKFHIEAKNIDLLLALL